MRTAYPAGGLAGAFVTAGVTAGIVVGATVMAAGPAVADQPEDDYFLARLAQLEIPALDGIPRLVYRANKVCDELDSGIPVDVVVGELNETTYGENPILRLRADRVNRTSTKFVIAAVDAYCPRNQGLVPPPP